MEIRQAINLYLTAKAYKDEDFKKKFENPNKNLDECVLYLQAKMLERVTEEQKKGGAGCVIPSDDEVFALAEQYYIDEDIKVDGTQFNNIKIVSASATSFTDEEKQKMREEAIKKYQDGVIAEMKKKDQEKKNKGKDKKPSNPVIVPDVPATKTSEKPKTEEKTEDKPKVVQMDLFDGF